MNKIVKYLLISLAIVGVLSVAAFAFIFYSIAKVDNKYTGEQLFTAVNKHRKSVGVPELQQELPLCDNLVERWLAIKNPNSGHKGFEEWAKAEGISNNPNYSLVGELYITASTPENAVAWWVGSPGHRLTLEKKEMNVGCAYANDGYGVVIMAQKVPQTN